MANSGGGNKFVSVNLNKYYAQQSSKQHYHSHHSGSYESNRVRAGAGSGGMVVLSRPRSSQKSGSKLSVPPPLNLPSLRKEHERFDSLGPGGVPACGGASVSGPRPGSSGMGWAKPGSVAWQEKEGLVGGDDHVNDGVDRLNADDGMTKVSSGVYMPPSVRSGSTSSTSASAIGFLPLHKATVLKREEFPSLQAALPVVSGAEKKQTDGLNQKQKQLAMAGQELSDKHGDGSRSNSVTDMLPQLRSGRIAVDSELSEKGGEARRTSGSRLLEQGRKQDEYFPGPLPLVRLNPRSDWADDERDTGHVSDHRRDQGYSKTEAYWDRDFEKPRAGVLPDKPAHGLFDRRGLRDNDTGRTLSSEVAKLDPYSIDARLPSREVREGNAWRASSPLPKDGIGTQEIARDRNSVGTRPSSMNREKENKYTLSFRDNAQGDNGRRDLGYGNGGRQAWNNSADSFSSRGSERSTRERYGNEQYNRHKGNAFQNSSLSKPSFPLGGKAVSLNDPILNFSRDKRPLSKNEKSYLEDPLVKDFGATRFIGWDPFSANLVGVVKKKKDTVKQTDFHDPVRESFEAELERVQKMQEQERQRIIEEQERALELARREEEERQRLAREQEEQQRRLEEEAREAAWRAEQERLDALRRAEEQRIAREEEKRRIVMEEERRKQAAKQKLLELEERIAKRQAEAVKGVSADEKIPGMAKETDASKATGVSDWEDGERMVERITTSASSDSSLTRELDELHLEDNESPDMMDNLVLGFNDGVEVGMPNDEFESSQKDSAYVIPQISIGSLEEKISLDDMHSDRKILQSMDAPCPEGLDSSSRILQETEKGVQDLTTQPNTSPQASTASQLIDHVDATSCTGVSTEHNLPYSVNMASHSSSGQISMPTSTSVTNHTEVPVKLQFGLFSGPSLIPSPVPAIQIGSIQMPLHLHPQVGPPSVTQMHPSQPLFQFGQLRYTSPISQGLLPLAPLSVSSVLQNVPAHFSLNPNPNPGAPLPVQPSQDTSGFDMMKCEVSSPLDDNQSGLLRSLHLLHDNMLNDESSTQAGESRKSVLTQHGTVEISNIGATRFKSGFSSEYQGHQNSVHRNFKALSSKQSEGELQTVLTSSHSVSKEEDLSGPRGQTYNNRGKKYVFTAKGSNSRSGFLASGSSRKDSTGYQRRPRCTRTEFRIRENSGKRQPSGIISSNHTNQVGLDENSGANGRGTGFSVTNRMRKIVVSKSKQTVESECPSSALGSSQEMETGNRNEKRLGKGSLMRSQNITYSGKGNLKRNIKEDVDAPLISGIVRVYEQPGIEAASDEDDFIEVRSKRQVLNDRREQREKEIKAKSRIAKVPPRKPCSIPQSSNRNSASANGVMNNVRTDFVTSEGHNLANTELSAGFGVNTVSQPLAPIGTHASKIDVQADIRAQAVKSLQPSSVQTTSGGGPSLISGLMFESKNKVFDNVQASFGSWGNSCINQKVMTLTQTQLDDAMKPVQFDTCAPVGDRNSSVTDPSMPPPSSILLKDESFSNATSPINSLLAGEKIQFGAVTSPTVILPSSRAVSHGIGLPGSSRSEIQIPCNLSAAEKDCALFFEKEEHASESCVHMEDSSDNKGFGGVDIDVINTGDGGQQLASQSKAEESLSVSLPADLSVENPPISLWPPLASPQSSSSQMISHFPGGPPSHFPFYDIPMMGGPVFALGPHEESSSTQSLGGDKNFPTSKMKQIYVAKQTNNASLGLVWEWNFISAEMGVFGGRRRDVVFSLKELVVVVGSLVAFAHHYHVPLW
ncbi:hypothetical protein GOBAR_DD12950 [Gossypium barbadense]|nr:hypothetical protein GOBAR_DD12950 [Gossypium barbadense]